MNRISASFRAAALASIVAFTSPTLAQTEVADAAMRRDAAEVRRLVEHGADVKAAQPDGARPDEKQEGEKERGGEEEKSKQQR